MSHLDEIQVEQLATKLAHLLHKNWIYADTMIKTNLRVALTKKEALTVARRAIEIMEEIHI